MHHSHQLTAAIEADTEVDMLSAVSAMLRELTAGSRIGTSDGKRKIAYTTSHLAPADSAVSRRPLPSVTRWSRPKAGL